MRNTQERRPSRPASAKRGGRARPSRPSTAPRSPQAIAWCGGENVFASLPVPAPVVNVEEVLAQKPALIVAGTEGARRPAWLDAWRRWPELPAARDAGLAVVDADLMHRPGPRFVDGVAQLCAAVAKARE